MTGIRHTYDEDDYCYPLEVSWSKIFADLKNSNVRTGQIAELIGIPQSSLQRIREGVEPRHSIGQSLIRLHSRYCST
jgi:hypothetical protein